MEVQSLGWEDPMKKSMAAHSSILAWRVAWTEDPGGLQFIGSQRVRHDCNDLACMNELREERIGHKSISSTEDNYMDVSI